jgi:hypothetical protein
MVKLLLGEKGALKNDFQDEVLAGALLAHDGRIRHEATAKVFGLEPARA